MFISPNPTLSHKSENSRTHTMSNFCNPEPSVSGPSNHPPTAPPPPPSAAQCSTYTFPEVVRSPENRGHLRSVSHGGSTSLGGSNSAGVVGRPSALKGSRGHQRAFSQGQIGADAASRPGGHSRVGSKTDFILPPGHKDSDNVVGGSTSKASAKGHSRQASRSESIYTLRRSAPPPWWRRLLCVLLRRSPKSEPEERC